jgi:dolichyl-diphosphooligosaccharide--protein glycosyltransferase
MAAFFRHALVLILVGRFSNRLYVAFTVFYVLGELLAMQIPFVGFQPVKTSEHMAAFGVFGLLQVRIVKFLSLLTLFSWSAPCDT